MHIIRNSIDHGIEPPQERSDKGKPETGKIEIKAGYEGDLVIIEVADDGRGIDSDYVKDKALERGIIESSEAEELSKDELRKLIFEPGFSTRDETTETSGRGVGMDVVKSNVLDLNGSIELESEIDAGTTFKLKLPLTLAIVEVLLVKIGRRQYALPLSSVQEVIRLSADDLSKIGEKEVADYRGETLSIVHLEDILGWERSSRLESGTSPVIVAQSGQEKIGIMVEQLLEKREIVIKDLGSVLDNVPYISGATIMGDGEVVLILDAGKVVQKIDEVEASASTFTKSSFDQGSDSEKDIEKDSVKILLVEDIRSQRIKLRNTFRDAGYSVEEASNGEEALIKAKQNDYDLISTDIRMPGMDGYELTRELRSLDNYRSVPIMMVSTLDEKIDKERGFTSGADEYIEKPFTEDNLLETTRELLANIAGIH